MPTISPCVLYRKKIIFISYWVMSYFSFSLYIFFQKKIYNLKYVINCKFFLFLLFLFAKLFIRFSPTIRADEQINQFVEGLGPGQLVGRQVLGAPSLGDIQLSLCCQKNCLEVEVIRARGLQVSWTTFAKLVFSIFYIFILLSSKNPHRKCYQHPMLKFIWFRVKSV